MFGHHVSWIEMNTHLAYPQFTFCNYFLDTIILNINVFCPLTKHLILCKTNSTLTITKHCNTRCISTELSI
jgi:hypothetical protein